LLDRRPAQLSGGQRQRVALGRALMRQPDIFLMDEPLSNLDAALRADIREELIRLHRAIGVTTVYVTHDQLEAISMADRLGVMFHGDLVQVGTPQEVFNRPVNLSVAKFLGAPPMNTFDAVLTDGTDGAVLSTAAGPVPVPRELAERLRQRSGQNTASWSVIAGVRPDDVRLVTLPSSHQAKGLDGTVDLVETLGAQQLVSVKCGQAVIRCRVDGRQTLSTGDAVCLVVNTDYLYLFDPDTQEELTRATSSPRSPGHADQDPMPSRERGLPFGNGAVSVSEVSAAGDSGMAEA
jgi:multiple sugar transport system ATP-binding protein